MAKLRFDPITYQFYYRCRLEDGAPATAAGFDWDPVRRRFYTEDPMVAMVLANRGDSYAKHLLADALEAAAAHSYPAGAGRTRRPTAAPGHGSGAFAAYPSSPRPRKTNFATATTATTAKATGRGPIVQYSSPARGRLQRLASAQG